MPHATPIARQFWVTLLAIAFLSACAPSRPKTEKPELKNGQEVSEAAAKATQEADIGALVLASSSMDAADAGQPEDEPEDTQSAPVDTPPTPADAGLLGADADASEDAEDNASLESDADTSGAPQ